MDCFRPWRGARINAVTVGPVGLYGGTFDPPHKGHLALVEAALQRLPLAGIWVLPAAPVHRKLSGRSDAKTRLRWLQTIFSPFAAVSVCDWELRQGRPVAAIETLRWIHRQFPRMVPWLLLGADAWAGMETWVDYPEHQKLCNVVVFDRQGVHLGGDPHGWIEVEADAIRNLRTFGHVVHLHTRLPDVSATRLRQDLEHGVGALGRVPAAIEKEVEDLYGGQELR